MRLHLLELNQTAGYGCGLRRGYNLRMVFGMDLPRDKTLLLQQLLEVSSQGPMKSALLQALEKMAEHGAPALCRSFLTKPNETRKLPPRTAKWPVPANPVSVLQLGN